jgi:outer membrane immunogenic protein
MIKAAYGLAALAALGVSSANAADLPRAMPTKAPVMAPVYNWTGFYVGGHVGYAWGDPEATVTPGTAPLPTGATFTAIGAPFTLSTEPDGWLGGLLIGYNAQFNQFVLGVEADISFSNIKDSSSGSFINLWADPDAGRTLGTVTLDTKVEWFGTFRGRAGYAFNTFLPYVTGGLAWGHIKTTVTSTGSHFDIGGGLPGVLVGTYAASASFGDTQFGWTIGGGFDWAITRNWIARGEYLYINFPGRSHTAVLPAVTAVDSGLDMHVARAAIVYRFGP